MLTAFLLDRNSAIGFACDMGSAAEIVASDRKCHMPCPVGGCNGRCDHAYGHGGQHECDANASHPNW